MPLIVLLGGARSGKSQLAVELAAATGTRVTFIASGEAGDAEMAERIGLHQAARPATWETIEEPYELEEALKRADPAHAVILDCLTLWVATALDRDNEPDAVLTAAARAAATAAARLPSTIAVSNEVGLGIVPATPLGRRYRDLLGSVNRIWVEASSQAALVVAGRALPLTDAHSLVAGLALSETT